MSRLTNCLVVAAVLLGAGGAQAQNGDELWRQAQGFYEEFTWDRAIELFGRFVAENAQDERVPEAKYKILDSQFRLEKYEEFAASIEQYIAQYPHTLWSARAQHLLAKHLYNRQRWSNWDRIGNLFAEALRDYRAAIGRRPMSAAEQRVYVDLLFDAADFYADWYYDRASELAEEHLRTIIRYDLDADTTGRAWLLLGQLFVDRFDNVAKAQQAWLTVVHEYPKSEWADDALYQLAQHDERTGDYVRARARYLMLRRTYPQSPYEDDAEQRIKSIEQPRLNLRVSATHLPGASIPTRINTRNIGGVQFVAWQIPTDDIVQELGRRDVSTPEALLKGNARKVFTWRQRVPDKGQYEFHQLKLDSPMRAAGLYVVEARADGHPELVARSVVNVSSLVLVQNFAAEKLVNYVASRTNRQPVDGVALRIFRPREKGIREIAEGRTDADGLWQLPIPPRRDNDDWRLMTVGRKGDELVIQDDGLYAYWNQPTAQLQGYVYTDRPVYRPGDTVHYRAILRSDLAGDFENLPNQPVEVTVRDARGEELQKVTLTTDAFGTIGGELTLGDEPTLGVYNLQLTVDGQNAGGSFRVEEYRKPEFEVKVGEPLAEVRPGGAAAVPITATYYFGAPVADAEVHYVVQRRPYWHSYWWRGPWDWFYSGWREERRGWYGQQMVAEGTIKTDADGQAIVEFTTTDDSQDYVYTIQAEVADVTRRVVEASGSLTVTQKGFYLFASTNQSLYAPGDDITATAKAETADSQPVETAVDLTLWTLKWVPEKKDPKTGQVTVAGHHERDQKVWAQPRRITTDPATGEEAYLFKASGDGFYELEMVAPDTIDPQASVTATTRFWVASEAWKGVNYNHANLQVITEKDLYERGETARLLINSPVSSGAILLTIGAEQIYDTRVIRFERNSTVIDVPIPDNYSPNVFLKATVVAARQVYFAEKELMVPPTDELLKVKVESDQAEYQPRSEGTFTITTTDQNGKPVPAQVSLGITDESVYAIQEEMVQPIGAFFYGGRRSNNIRTAVSFEAYGEYDEDFEEQAEGLADRASARRAPGAPPAPMASEAAPMAKAADGMGGGAGGEEPVTIREYFPDTIVWQPTVTTDANGKATVTVQFPDSLTTWRATARAITKDTHVGQQVERVITTKDLIVRLQAPRFFTQLDRSTISMIVTNKTDQQQQVALGLQVDGLQLVGDATGSVVVAPRGQARLDREVVAAEPGRATITVTARGPNDSDGLKLNFNVIPHGAEKFANEVGMIGEAGAAAFDLNLPAARRDGATSLQVSVQPTLASTLLDALPYLIDYPYGCVEQTTSKFLPAVMVARTLDYTGRPDPNGKPMPAPEWWKQRNLDELPEMVKTGIKRLAGMQNPDGGFGWFGGMRSDLWMTSYVVYGLTQARLADFTVPEQVLRPAVTFLYRNLHLTKDRLDTAAYLAHVLSKTQVAGILKPDADGTKALEDAFQRVYANRDDLNDYTRALLILGLVNKGERDKAEVVWRNLQARRIETEHGVHWGQNRWGWRWSEDQVETTAYSLQAALAIEPGSDLAQKAVQWLVLNRTANHWYSTKDTAAAVFAIVKYADAHDELNPNYTLVLKVNGADVKGWEVNRDNALTLDGKLMVDPSLLKTGDNRIELVREGTGRAYYSAFLEYYTQEEPITAASSYLSATRKYYRISEYTDPEDNRRKTKRELIENGAVVPSGQEIEVEITVEAENDFDHVCFADPKPAGYEPVDQTSGGTWGGAWLYRELRDEEVTFFADHISQGKTTFTYRLRAESPGTFHALPHNGFSMYRPDVRCLSDEDLLRVGEREAPAEE